MLHQLNTSHLAHLDAEARRKELDALVRHAKDADGTTAAYLKSRIRTFELRYEMSSEELLEALAEGRQKETADVAEWLFLLEVPEAHGE